MADQATHQLCRKKRVADIYDLLLLLDILFFKIGPRKLHLKLTLIIIYSETFVNPVVGEYKKIFYRAKSDASLFPCAAIKT